MGTCLQTIDQPGRELCALCFVLCALYFVL
jgi:hypothetical protein